METGSADCRSVFSERQLTTGLALHKFGLEGVYASLYRIGIIIIAPGWNRSQIKQDRNLTAPAPHAHANRNPNTPNAAANHAVPAMASRSAAFLDGSDAAVVVDAVVVVPAVVAAVVAADSAVLAWETVAVVANLVAMMDANVDAAGQGLLDVQSVDSVNTRSANCTKSAGTLAEQGAATRSEPGGLMGMTFTHWWVPLAYALGQLGLGTVSVFSSTVMRNPGRVSHVVSVVSRRLTGCPPLAVRKRMDAGEDWLKPFSLISLPLGPSEQLSQFARNLSGQEPALVKPNSATSIWPQKKVVSLEAESPQDPGTTWDMVWKLPSAARV